MEYYTKFNSILGELTLVSDGQFLTGLWIEGQKGRDLRGAHRKDNLEIFIKTKNWLEKYFEGVEMPPQEIEIKFEGSEFSCLVWQELLKIPYGKTITYGELANIVKERLGRQKMSARAIGRAVGHNPIAIIVPCHRVIGAKGKLTGYAGGIDKKIILLKLEKIL